MKRVVYIYIVYVSVLTWMVTSMSSCANIIAPTGGLKDTLAPVLDTAESSPKMEQLNYQQQTVDLYFNEWIETKKLKQELIITPRVKDYTYKVIKKRLKLTFAEPLDSNTTYNLDFRESIVDITEKNPVRLRLAFSTGNQLDTMEVKGKVKEVLTNAPAKKTLLALYKADDTLDVAKHPPYYLTETNDAGFYNFKNIKAGRYRIYAIKDQNNNKYYNKGEMIGFSTSIVDLGQGNQDSLNLDLVKEDYIPPKLLSKIPKKHYFEVQFNEGLQTIRLDSGQTNLNQKVLYTISTDGKKLTFYSQRPQDSLRLRVIATDSASNRLSQEITLRFRNKPIKKRDRQAFTATIAPQNDIGIVGKQLALKIDFTKPVKSFDRTKLKYLIDADTTNLKPLLDDSSSTFQWNQYKTQLKITRPISFKQSIQFVADSAAFISAINDTSSTIQTKLERLDPTKIGIVNVKLETSASNLIVQILDQEFNLIKEQKSPGAKTLQFENLAAGTYTLRVIIDTNNNGKWDFSDYKNGKPAEKIFFASAPIQLRANWEQNITVKF